MNRIKVYKGDNCIEIWEDRLDKYTIMGYKPKEEKPAVKSVKSSSKLSKKKISIDKQQTENKGDE